MALHVRTPRDEEYEARDARPLLTLGKERRNITPLALAGGFSNLPHRPSAHLFAIPSLPNRHTGNLPVHRPMEISAARGSGTPDPVAAARGADRSHLLNNSCFPVLKTWGSERVIRCLILNGRGKAVNAGQRQVVVGSGEFNACRPPGRPQEEEVDDGGGLEGIRENLLVEGKKRIGSLEEAVLEDEEEDGELEQARTKLMVHLSEAADRVKLAVGSGQRDQEREAETEMEAEPPPSSAAAYKTRPWNLRARTAMRKVARYGFESDAGRSDPLERPVRVRPRDDARRERPTFSISLSSQEIAEDIYAVTGSLPRRRPRRRPWVIQRQLDALFPGTWLTEITADLYKVPD